MSKERVREEKGYKFHVIELLEPPYIDPEINVCVPDSWILPFETSDDIALVKLPVGELSEIKKRAEKQEFSENWTVFSAYIKYSTNSYKDASDFINILSKIYDQEQSSTKLVKDIPSTSDKKIHELQSSSEINNDRTTSSVKSDEKPVSKEIPKQLDLISAEVRLGQKKSKVDTPDSFPRARIYLPRQSPRMSLSGNNAVSLPDQTTSKENLPETSHCVEESDKTNNNQEHESSAKNSSELIRKYQLHMALRSLLDDNFKELLEPLHNEYEKNQLVLQQIRPAFMMNCKIIKEFIDLTNEVNNDPDKTSNSQENEPSTKNPSKLTRKGELLMVLRSHFGDNFKGAFEQLHNEFEKNQLLLEQLRLAFIGNYKIIKELIDLTDQIRNSPNISDLDLVKEIENSMMEVNINKSNSDKATGSKVQNDGPSKKEEKKHNSDGSEIKNNNPLSKIRAPARKFTLPPEYDPNDSRWTLKHREMKSGLVELLPYSRVYIDAFKLSNSKMTSRDSRTLTRNLLQEIFTENALSICSLTGRKANAFYLEGTSLRPALDEHARIVLLNYVKKHAAEQNWAEFDSQQFSNTIRNKLQDMRGKYQNIVEK